MNIEEFIVKLNNWGREKVPFLFLVDFEKERPFACRLEEAADLNIFFDIDGFSNSSGAKPVSVISLKKYPMSLAEYQKKFEIVSDRLRYGDSFLTNLTIKTEIQTDRTLKDIFFLARAKFKLLYHDDFLVFSPEPFVRISNGRIFAFPMKGTIDAATPNAREVILADPKELAEHVTIVDLMRNDLSQVASGVTVTRFRYIDELKTNHKNLLQVSSEIVGQLPADYDAQLGTILVTLLPAGSVSGAPKARTIEIIRLAEEENRSYYTGVFGYFNGTNLESAVMIRFIERVGQKLYYRSGGGVTTQSVVLSEYQEAIDKIYVPVD